MTDENGTLLHKFNQLKIETEANMKILEANLKEALAANREAFAELKAAFEHLRADTKTAYESLRADTYKVAVLISTILGAFIAFTGLLVIFFG